MIWEGIAMDSTGLQHQLLVALDDLDHSKVEVQKLKKNLKDDENFIQSLKGKLSPTKRERNLLIK
jgi:hypothetical protein